MEGEGVSGPQTISQSDEKFGALKFSSATQGAAIAVVGGQAKVPGNVIYYADFTAIPHTSSQTQGGKGGTTTNSTSYTYTAGLIIGIAHGQIGDVVRIWRDKEVFTGGYLPSQIGATSETYTIPASGAMTYQLTQGATLQAVTAITYPVTKYGKTQIYPLAEGSDYTISVTGLLTILKNDYRGRVATIRYTYGVGVPGKTPAQQLGFTLQRGTVGQSAPSWVTTRHPEQALGYSGLACVSADAYQLGSGAQVQNHVFEVRGIGSGRYPGSVDCNPADFIAELLSNGRFGARMPSAKLSVQDWSDYCAAAGLLMSPALTSQRAARDVVQLAADLTNSAAIWSVDTLKIIPYGDTPLTGNGVTYSPPSAAVYTINDDVWLSDSGAEPVQVTATNPIERANLIELQYSDRQNNYSPNIARATDDADARINGLRKQQAVTDASWICEGAVARAVAQLQLQRSLSVINRYKFSLPWSFALLEPMDVVSITDPVLGTVAVRITGIEEDFDGTLSIEGEDYPAGVATASVYPVQAGGSYLHDFNVAPGPIMPPVIFEPPEEIVTTGLEVWAAVDGAGANWGGCNVWVSTDGSNYALMGTTQGGARIGALTAAAGSSGTVSVTSTAPINNASATDAATLSSLIYIGGASPEYAAYTTSTLTGPGAYTLTVPVRGAYDTAAAAHEVGAPFVRVDDAIVKGQPLSLSMIGQKLYFKFCSFNSYGLATQGLADVDAYTYTVTGAMAKLPPANVPWVQASGPQITFGAVSGVSGYRIRAGLFGSTDWATAMPLHDGLVTSSPYTSTVYPPGVVTLMCKAVDKLGNESTTAAAQAGVSIAAQLAGNVGESFAQSPTFPGTIVGGALVTGGKLVGPGSTALFWANPAPSPFWGTGSAAFWPGGNSSQSFGYVFSVTPSRSGWLVLGETVTGATYSATYSKSGNQSPFWANSGSFWPTVTSGQFWPASVASVSQAWPGAVQCKPQETYSIAISVNSASGPTAIASLVPYVDVPTIFESLTLTLPPGGRRLPITQRYTAIKSLQLTLKNDGLGASYVTYEDLDLTGPFVECYTAAGGLTAGTISADITGY